MSVDAPGSLRSNAWQISASSLAATTLQMQVTANNIANGNTNGFIPARVDNIAQSSGGVSGVVVLANEGMLDLNPPQADSTPEIPSQTDYATEGISLTLAKHAFTANVQAFKAQDETLKSILDAFG